MATYDLTQIIPSSIESGDILNCPYSGTVQTITLPLGQYKLEVWGAEGGYRSSNTYSGKGGYSIGTLTLEQDTQLFLYAGGAGGTSSTNTYSIVAGGFNGGGYRYGFKGGGGGSDIRIGTDSLYARVIVAGGGGSDGYTSYAGGYGGGESGGRGTFGCGSYGYGGNQTSSYTSGLTVASSQDKTGSSSSSCAAGFGFGGFGVARSSGYGGAGGGGWYGGEGAYPDSSVDDDGGGGGGSGYIYTSATASKYPTGCLLNSSYYLTSASMINGNVSMLSPTGTTETGHSGNGYVRITVINTLSKPYLKNLLKYGDFENQGWTAGSNCSLAFDSSIKKYTNYSLKVSITRTSIGEAYFYQTVNPSMVQNHKYYVCCWLYLPTSSSATGMQVYWPEAEPNMGTMVADTTKVNQWQKLSLVTTRTNWSSGNQKFRFDIEGSISPNYVYVDGAMLIDLTDCYGEGKEPTKEWCDNNISFFTDGIKRQVIVAKYVKINGEWKEI